MDIRLYKKAKLLHDPFNFDEFKQRKIKEKIEKERENRVRVDRKLPIVNTELAKRLIEEKQEIAIKNKQKVTKNSFLHLTYFIRFMKIFNLKVQNNKHT